MQITQLGNLNPLSANPAKWSNTLKQFVGNFPKNCLSVFDHFVGLVLKGLRLSVDETLCQKHVIKTMCDTLETFTSKKEMTYYCEQSNM